MLPFVFFCLPPPDLTRFPPREDVRAACAFNRAYQAHLQARQALDPVHWWDYQGVLAEVNALYAVWDALDDAQIAHDPRAAWVAVFRLRDLLGEPAFRLGIMPPPAPLQYFVDLTP